MSRIRLQPDDRLAFLHGFLRKPQQVGSVIPSSRFLERRVVEAARVARSRVVVELGPGTGGTTRAILSAQPPGAALLSIEINPRFVAVLRSIDDPRLVVHEGSAEQLGEALARYGLPAPDAVISGIPFSTMSPRLGRRIIEAVHSVLAPGGRFVAYQLRGNVSKLARGIFAAPRVEAEYRNIPPMRVYRWQKQVGLRAPAPLAAVAP